MATPKVSGIYEIVNLVSGKRYVGSCLNFRARWHKHKCDLSKQRHHSKHLQNAWNLYGPDAIEFRVLELCGREVLLDREQFHINQGCDYNKCLVAGSPLGVKHSEAARKKMSDQRRGRKLASSHAEALALASKDRWRDSGFRERMSAAIAASYDDQLRSLRGKQMAARWADASYRESLQDKIRKSHGPDRRAKTSKQSKERWADPVYREKMKLTQRTTVSEETRRKISASLTGRPMAVETKRKKGALTDAQAAEVLRLRMAGCQYEEIATVFGVSSVSIARICRRERYQWVEPHIPPMIDTKRRRKGASE